MSFLVVLTCVLDRKICSLYLRSRRHRGYASTSWQEISDWIPFWLLHSLTLEQGFPSLTMMILVALLSFMSVFHVIFLVLDVVSVCVFNPEKDAGTNPRDFELLWGCFTSSDSRVKEELFFRKNNWEFWREKKKRNKHEKLLMSDRFWQKAFDHFTDISPSSVTAVRRSYYEMYLYLLSLLCHVFSQFLSVCHHHHDHHLVSRVVVVKHCVSAIMVIILFVDERAYTNGILSSHTRRRDNSEYVGRQWRFVPPHVSSRRNGMLFSLFMSYNSLSWRGVQWLESLLHSSQKNMRENHQKDRETHKTGHAVCHLSKCHQNLRDCKTLRFALYCEYRMNVCWETTEGKWSMSESCAVSFVFLVVHFLEKDFAVILLLLLSSCCSLCLICLR